MSIRSIENVSSSLNLGLIYKADYSWSQKEGVRISLTYVNQNGNYRHPSYLSRNYVRIGNASFTVFPVSSEIQLDSGRRVISVDFVDEFYKLDHYYITLTGRGCGNGIYELGEPVDNRALSQKIQDSLDPDAQKVKEFTSFPDLEYSFTDFINVIRRNFNVSVNTSIDNTLKKNFVGTFREVLESWCNYLNLSFFFENGRLKIFNPATLSINFPSVPNDAYALTDRQSAEDTYSKTVFNWLQQEGGPFEVNEVIGDDTELDNGPLLVRTQTLYPLGYESNLPQTQINLNQASAAQYGQEVWFLYNYYKGSLQEECGWTIQKFTDSTLSIATENAIGANIKVAAVDPDKFNKKFEAYAFYGQNIAGRYYLSPRLSNITTAAAFTWFDESDGQIFKFDQSSNGKQLRIDYLSQQVVSNAYIPGTEVNEYFPGVIYNGGRMVYNDTYERNNVFTISDELKDLVDFYFNELNGGIDGQRSMDFSSELGQKNFVSYKNVQTFPQEILNLFKAIETNAELLKPRFKTWPIKGIKTIDYVQAKQEEGGNDLPNRNKPSPQILSNTGIMKVKKEGSYIVYYDKYSDCKSFSDNGNYFRKIFTPIQISSDIPVQYKFNKNSKNVYTITRDYNTLNKLINNPALSQLARARSFLTKEMSFSVNYFYPFPSNYLSAGFVGASISVSDNGVECTYNFSNSVLRVPDASIDFERYDQRIRNSWIRQYNPTQVIQ